MLLPKMMTFWLLLSFGSTAHGGYLMMPWLCLERCGFNTTDIDQQVSQLADNADVFNAVSFELFNLGPGSTLITNNLTNVAPILRQRMPQGTLLLAMVSSFPYPPQFIEWMRQVFANPQPFLQDLLAELQKRDIDGVNFDWEPTGACTDQDALAYASFLGLAGTFLTQNMKTISVDVAGWSKIWNYSAIATALTGGPGPVPPFPNNIPGPFVMTMSTYTYNTSVFQKELELAAAAFSQSLLVTGIQTWNSTLFPVTVLEDHLNSIHSFGICQVAIWDGPIPESWLPLLRNFRAACVGTAR